MLAYAVLTFAWIFSNPVFAAPDEYAHVVRAESIGYGQLIGAPPEGNVLGPKPPGVPASTHRQQESWAKQNTRLVSIPAGKNPQWGSCSADPLVPAICLTAISGATPPAAALDIPTGNYEPFPYLLPALVARAPATPNHIALGMRLVRAALALAMVAIAFLLLWRPGCRGLSAVGLLVAITPMVVFLAATVNPSGLEIVSAIAFFSALMRLVRPERAHAAVWAALGTSGVFLSLSRGQAPVWVVLDVVLVLALIGGRRALDLFRGGGRWAWGAAAAVTAAIALNRVWEAAYGPSLPVSVQPPSLALISGWFELPEVLREEIGKFDYLESGISPLAYLTWYCVAAGLVAIAMLVGTRRERLVLLGALVTSLALPVALVAAVMRHTGYGLQGRYVLAFSVVIPLLAGEVVFRNRETLARLNAGALALVVAPIVAIIQLDGVYANARRFAVGVAGPQWFVGHAVAWAPRGGWWLWFLVMATGAVLLGLVGPLAEIRSRPGRSGGHAATADVAAQVERQ